MHTGFKKDFSRQRLGQKEVQSLLPFPDGERANNMVEEEGEIAGRRSLVTQTFYLGIVKGVKMIYGGGEINRVL